MSEIKIANHKKVYIAALIAVFAVVLLGIFKGGQSKSLRFLNRLRDGETIEKIHPSQLIHVDWYGKKVPNFEVADLEGKTHELKEYRGKEVMIVFWATWCPYCRNEMIDLIELRKEKSKDEFVLLAISYEKEEAIKAFVKNKNINYPIIAADAESMPRPYNSIPALPASMFIGKNGVLKASVMGAKDISVTKALIESTEGGAG